MRSGKRVGGADRHQPSKTGGRPVDRSVWYDAPPRKHPVVDHDHSQQQKSTTTVPPVPAKLRRSQPPKHSGGSLTAFYSGYSRRPALSIVRHHHLDGCRVGVTHLIHACQMYGVHTANTPTSAFSA